MSQIMEKSKIWLSSPHMGGNEQKYINEAFAENWIAPLGPNVNGFEKDIEQYLKEDVFVAALSSGTAALHLGLILLDVKRDDFVICQSMTFSASANPILYQNAIPVFIDSERDTWNMCPNALKDAIESCITKGKKPKAIIPVHLYGMPYKIEEIRAIADEFQIPILEDSAEALGSSYNNQRCGTFGDISVLSFNGNKIITTSGGGALVTKSKNVKDKTVFFATQSRDNAPHYQHSEVGYNYRMSNICAGIGRGQMEVLDAHVKLRREMNQFYVNYFSKIDDVFVLQEPSRNYSSNYWLSAILLKSYEQREALRLALESENIESRPLWKPMHLQPIFEKYPFFGNGTSEDLFNRGLCLPSSSNISLDERNRIQTVLDIVFKK
jgi:dTDP-4-amino-4,6-dideoxygalactose transaminase